MKKQQHHIEKDTYLIIDLAFWLRSHVDTDLLNWFLNAIPPRDSAAAIDIESVSRHMGRYFDHLTSIIEFSLHPDLIGVINSSNKDGKIGLDFNLSRMRAVCVVLSPEYCSSDAFEVFADLVRKYSLELLDCLPAEIPRARPTQPLRQP
jgi:hypothetical protein